MNSGNASEENPITYRQQSVCNIKEIVQTLVKS